MSSLSRVHDAGCDCTAPRVGRLVRKAVGEPFRHRNVQRLIRGVVRIRKKQRLAQLRIGEDKIFRKSIGADVVAGISAQWGSSSQIIGEPCRIASREEAPGLGIHSQRCGAGHRCPIDCSQSEIETPQHPIE